MAKTLEQVLAVRGLTAAQKERAQEWVKAQERFGKPTIFEVTTDQQVKDRLTQLQNNYVKRKEREEKNKQKKELEKQNNQAIFQAVKEAKELGFSIEDIVDVIHAGIKEKKNEKIRAQIEALQAQLID